MDDATTTIAQLRDLISAFSREREWDQFHTPKDLAAALSVEAGELLELFLWQSATDVEELTRRPEARARIAEELADVFIFCCNLANRLEIGLSSAVGEKLAANAVKYPVEKAKGSNKKYTDL